MTPLAKRLAIALAIAVALILLLSGVLVGQVLQRRATRSHALPTHSAPAGEMRGPRGERRPGARKPDLRHDDGLPRGGAFRKALRAHAPELAEQRREGARAREAVKKALEAEPFDRQALEGALEALRNETSRGQALTHRALVESAAAGGREGRQQIASEFERPQRRRP